MKLDSLNERLRIAWEIVATVRQQISKRQTQIQMDKQEIWLQMQCIHAITAKLRERELLQANLGNDQEMT